MSAQLPIGENTVVTAEFWIYDTDGQELDNSRGPVAFLHGGLDSLLPKLDEALKGKTAGFEQTYHLEPQDAFGEYDVNLLRVEPRALFPEPLEIGMQFEGIPGERDEETGEITEDPDSDEPPLLFAVRELADDKVVLDANHPFAGMAIRVRIRILDVREAEPEEVEQGYADDEDESDEVMDAMLESRRISPTLH